MDKKENPDSEIEGAIQAGYRYAHALTHHHYEAEDLVQEAWMRTWRKYGRKSTQGLLFATIRHCFIDRTRRKTAQLDPAPLQHEVPVGTELVIGPKAKKPLRLEIPLFVSDMSFGALSQETKIALSKGTQMAGTGICSGEGGMLPEEIPVHK